jgi:hypothetical protein
MNQKHFFIFYFLFFIFTSGQDKTLGKMKIKRNAFGFNLDWHMGYNYARSGAPLEFAGRSPSPDLLGGSFDYIYKGDWQINLSWKSKATFFRHVSNFDAGPNYNNLNKGPFGYESKLGMLPPLLYTSNGILVSKRLPNNSKWSHFIGLGLGLNRFRYYEKATYGVEYFNPLYTSGNVVYNETIYKAEIEFNENLDLRKNIFLPQYYNNHSKLPIWGWFSNDVVNQPLVYLISYKIAYTAYYPVFKGKMQLLIGCGFEYSPKPIAYATYKLYSKYDNVNTSGTYKRYMSNAFVKVGFRFGRMGVRIINVK